ncbi:hypothetical protein [Halioglobus sp. HI00S01]|nr:hypothetical protein [Halioglobus sp. HI00S01]
MKTFYTLACVALISSSTLLSACSTSRSDARVEARTEARTSERVEDRRD